MDRQQSESVGLVDVVLPVQIVRVSVGIRVVVCANANAHDRELLAQAQQG